MYFVQFCVMLMYHRFEQLLHSGLKLLHSGLKFTKIQNIWIVKI